MFGDISQTQVVPADEDAVINQCSGLGNRGIERCEAEIEQSQGGKAGASERMGYWE